jgi:hypothetical protein
MSFIKLTNILRNDTRAKKKSCRFFYKKMAMTTRRNHLSHVAHVDNLQYLSI